MEVDMERIGKCFVCCCSGRDFLFLFLCCGRARGGDMLWSLRLVTRGNLELGL